MGKRVPVGIVGSGAMGTALGVVLGRKGVPVLMWGRRRDLLEKMRTTRFHPERLPGILLPEEIEFTSHIEDLKGVESWIYALPSQALRNFATENRFLFEGGIFFLLAAKGIELNTGLRMDEVLREVIGEEPVRKSMAVVSGPMFALELARGLPTVGVVASYSSEVAQYFQELFATPSFRVYTSDDVVGVEVAGALKNVIALAAGASDGLGLGLNARAALITRGLAEITRFGVAMGANPLTFIGLAGVGDLLLTATGDLSRNRTVGYRLGKGESLEEILSTMKEVVEGVPTTLSAVHRARDLKVEIPIIQEIGEVLFNKKPIERAIYDLMTRALKPERIL